jgi:NADP-dependent 3-hydroxy acid dehydrogenase YdfG
VSDRVVAITGASSGIGAALAEQLADKGDRVVPVARRSERLAEVAAQCAGSAHAIAADVTSRTKVRRVAGEAISHFGHMDVWVNTVGTVSGTSGGGDRRRDRIA